MSDKPRNNNLDGGTSPRLTVLQLDTTFPRIPGDVASPETYQQPIAIHRINKASVSAVINDQPDQMDISYYEAGARGITYGIGVTSCGFLGYWHRHLAEICPRPFVASSLVDLPRLMAAQPTQEMAILTFDAEVLRSPLYQPLLSGFDGKIIGLDPDMHLRRVIAEDLPDLDSPLAEQEIIDLLRPHLADGRVKTLILECTNLPPYKSAIKQAFDLEVYDILTSIHQRDADLVKPEFL